MDQEQKKKSKETILKDVFKIHQRTQIMRYCLLLNGEDDFNSDCIVMAKNMALEVLNSSLNIEHRLHELIDAPLIDSDAD